MNRHNLSLLSAPHRPLFFAGALLTVLLMLWWAVQLAGGGNTVLPAGWLHGFMMLYGFFPLFMLGFIFTAGPKWLAVPAPQPRYYLTIAALYPLGVALCLLGSQVALAWLQWGVGLMLLAWTGACLLWWRCVLTSRQADRWHAKTIATAFVFAQMGLIAALLWVLGYSHAWLWMKNLALWGFLLPVFLAVSHRMLPFFSNSVLVGYQYWRPYWLLQVWLAGCALHGLLDLTGGQQWRWLVDVPLALCFAWVSWRWGLTASLQVRLLAMLHLAFAWLAISFALFALESALLLMGQPLLAAAALHALTIGFFASMLVGFVSRVSLGHSGRPLRAEPALWAIYLAVHGVAVARVLAGLLPAWSLQLYWLAAAGWLLVFFAWCWRFLPVYLKPRADGQPG